MRKTFSILSFLSTLLGLGMIVSMSQGGYLFEILTFGTKGPSFIVMLNLYHILGFLFAILAERNKYRKMLFAFSISMLFISLFITFVAAYGFQEP